MRVVYDTFDENKGYIENKNRRYYFKLNGNDCIELVVEKIAKKLGICSAHYMLTNYDGKELYTSIYNDHYQNIKNLLGNNYSVGEGLGL